MTALLVCLLLPGILQQPTVTATVSGSTITVTWTANPVHPLSEWIAPYRVGAPLEPFPSSLYWRFVPAGATGDPLIFPIPGPGEWEARYLSDSNATLATSARLMIAIGDDPPPGDPLPVVQQNKPKIIRPRIVRANGAVELLDPELGQFIANPAEAKASQLKPMLGPGDELFIDMWEVDITVPEREADETYRIIVRRVIP